MSDPDASGSAALESSAGSVASSEAEVSAASLSDVCSGALVHALNSARTIIIAKANATHFFPAISFIVFLLIYHSAFDIIHNMPAKPPLCPI
jgi:hypothetical protein